METTNGTIIVVVTEFFLHWVTFVAKYFAISLQMFKNFEGRGDKAESTLAFVL